MSATPRSAILRAEILRADVTEVTCALEMTEESVFIVTEQLPSIGDVVHVRLSFPRAVGPLFVSVKVVQIRMASGPGTPPGFVAEFTLCDDATTEHIKELATRLRRPSGIAPPSRALSLLLVEDNQLIRDMFAYALDRYFRQRAGRVHLTQASSASAAWDALDERSPFDLAVVDHLLPEETGASLVAKLRAHPSFQRMSIVGMSVGGADVRRAMIDAGADIFLEKPIVLKDLFCTLEFLMDTPRGSDRVA